MLTDDQLLPIKALWFSAIMIYGKCFTSAEGRKVKLEGAALPQGFHAVHTKVMGYRNTLVAHAGIARHERSVLHLVLSPREEIPLFWIRPDTTRLEFVDDRNDSVTFEKLIDQVIDQVKLKVDKLLARIHDNEVAPFGPDHWQAEARI